jgi:glucose/arabinose dehydrogenase
VTGGRTAIFEVLRKKEKSPMIEMTNTVSESSLRRPAGWRGGVSRRTARRIKKFVLVLALGAAMLFLTTVLAGRAQSGAHPAALLQGPAQWPNIALTPTVNGLAQPLHITHAGDSSGRLFVVEKAGVIRIVRGGSLEPTAFLSITDRVGSSGGEQGLLSVAFPPDYATRGYFYVDYTDANGDTVVSRFHLTPDPDVADPSSEEIILTEDQPYANHNGGQLAFGPDGYLYIGLGDGGSGGDPLGNGQNPATLLGAILRIDVEPHAVSFSATHRLYFPLIALQGAGGALAYRIPPTNPFTQTAGYRDEIWAWGLRNPWRFSFDRGTGDLYIGDVGQGAYEEIDFQSVASPGGENYGWAVMEGAHCYPSGPCDSTGLVLPVAEYAHSQGCAAATGGVVYRGPNPDLQGIYFYGDYCSGRVWGLRQEGGMWTTQELADTSLNVASFGEDEAGNVYVADLNGSVYQLVQGP